MAKEFILKINGEPAAKTIAGIQEQIKALDETIKTSNIADPNFDNLVSESNKAKQALGLLQKEGVEGLKPKGAIDGLKNIGASLSSIPGPIGGAIQGFQGLSKAALAFVMNPIGAAITALVAVFAAVNKAIRSTEEGTFALNKVFGALGGVIKPITKAIGELAILVADGLVAAMEGAIKVAKFLGLDFAKAAEDGMKLAQTLNEIEEAEGDLAMERAEQNKLLAEAKDILTDTNKTFKERKAALDQVSAAETSLSQKEVDLAKKRLAAANEKKRQDGESKANKEAIEEATIKLAQTEQALAGQRRGFNREEKKLRAEEAAQAKEAAAQAKASADERIAAQDKIRAAEQKNLLASIKDQEDRDKKAAQLELENTKREIDRGKFTAAEKKKLKLQADESYALSLAKINEDAAAKEKATQKELLAALVNTDEEKFKQQQEQTTENYDKLIEKAKGNAELQTQLEAQKQELLLEQEKTFNEKVVADKKAAADKVKADEDKAYKDKIDAITLTYDKERALLEQKGLTSKELRKQQDELEIKELEEKLAATATTNDEFYKLELALFNKKKTLREQEKEEIIEALNASFDLAAGVANGLMELNQLKTDKILNDETKSEAEREKLAKEGFEKQKKLQYALAIIDGAKAITAILSVPDFTLGVASAIRIAAAVASTGFALSKISQTQFESKGGGGGDKPKASTAGSMYQTGGVLGGPSHDMGGIKTSLGEMEGGEFVVNRRATANFMPILNQINASGNVPGPETNTMSQTPIIKTYVVASDMTSQQEADAKLSSLASL